MVNDEHSLVALCLPKQSTLLLRCFLVSYLPIQVLYTGAAPKAVTHSWSFSDFIMSNSHRHVTRGRQENIEHQRLTLHLLTKYKVIFTKNESIFFVFSHRPLLLARSTFPVWCPSLCRLQAAPPPPRAVTRQCNALYVDWTRRCDLLSSYTAIIML